MASIQNSVLSTSLRSEIHATDSTCSGCRAKSAATAKGRHRAPVMRRSTWNRSRALAQWNTTLTRWCMPGFVPKIVTSSMCDSQVSGCQLEA